MESRNKETPSSAKSRVKCNSTYKNGKVHYRINATENALRALGVTPDGVVAE
jgi:hypothetical protein